MEQYIKVIITTYKRSYTIKQCIYNVLSQTYKNIDIIVVDDNGGNSPEQLATYKELQEFIENGMISYYPMEYNSGACAARNYGASIAQGAYIVFFDDDDEWDVSKLEKQYDVIKRNEKLGFVYCYQEAVDYKSGKVLFGTYNSIGKGDVYNKLLKIDRQSLATPNPLIRKSAFEKVGGFDEQLKSAQDIDLFVRIAKHYKVDFVPEVLHKAIIHSSERISSDHGNKISGYKTFLKKYSKDLEIETLTYIHSRIIFHCFFLKSKLEAHESIKFLKNHNKLSFKYKIFVYGLQNMFFRSLLELYLGIKSLVLSIQ